MIVVGANLTTDRTLYLSQLVPGTVARPHRAVVTPGGKAVNVCRAAAAFTVRPTLLANLPGRSGDAVGDLLAAEGHDVLRVPTSGEIRSATVILEDDGRTTVLNEPGPELTAEDRDALLAAFSRALPEHRVVAISGSLPPGPVAADLYARLTDLARAAGVRVVLDAARADLAIALPHHPDVVTPNLAEALAVITGEPVSETVEVDVPNLHAVAEDAARQLCARGAGAALVTLGRHGVVGHDGTASFWVGAPQVSEVNPIGAGDAFVGGLTTALQEGLPLPVATVRAVASGAASVATELAGAVDADCLEHLLNTPGLLACRPVPQGVSR